MSFQSQSEFEAVTVVQRLRGLFGEVELANGTPIADVVAAALVIDQRVAGARASAVAEIAREPLIQAAKDVVLALELGEHEFTLPLGTTSKSDRPGGLAIGGEQYVQDVDRPGLWAVEAVRRDAHGSNLDLLRQQVAQLTRRLACRRIGLPVAFFIVESDARDLLQFPPCEAAGGVVLQRSAGETGADRFCAANPEQIREFAKSIVADMRVLWKRRTAIAEQVGQTLRAVDAGLVEARAEGLDTRLAKICIDLSLQHENEDVSFYLEYEGIDEALRRGPVLDYVPGHNRPQGGVHTPPWTCAHRREKLVELGQADAHGWISDVAAAVADAAPEGRAAVLERLASDYQTYVALPTSSGTMHCTLYWRDGQIRAEISKSGRIDVYQDRLELTGVKLPETVIAGLVGRSLDEIVELPFRSGCAITDVQETARGLRLTLDVDLSFVNLDTGVSVRDPKSKTR